VNIEDIMFAGDDTPENNTIEEIQQRSRNIVEITIDRQARQPPDYFN
jgi:hypothetical protein